MFKLSAIMLLSLHGFMNGVLDTFQSFTPVLLVAIPIIEIPNNRNLSCIGSPNGKLDTRHTVNVEYFASKFVESLVMLSRFEKIYIILGK